MPEAVVDVDQEEVYIVASGGERTSYHLERGCSLLERSENGVKPVAASNRVLAGLETCRKCSGTEHRPTSRSTLAHRLENLHDPEDVGGGA